MTASSTTPPARTAWTTDIGARASAATWKPQAPIATTMPIANHFEREQRLRRVQRVLDVDRRRPRKRRGACRRSPRFVAKAQTSASRMPS